MESVPGAVATGSLCNRPENREGDPVATEPVSKVDFLMPKAFHNSAQGNTLGLGRAFEATLKALNNGRIQNSQVNEFLNPYRVISPSGSLIPGCYPGLC